MSQTTLLRTLLFIFIVAVHSCTPKVENKNENTIYVDLEKADKVSLWDIFSHIELIPLETNEESLIKGIRKLVHYDNNYYIFDNEKTEILIFDSNGKYLNKISDRGEGPDEYRHINDFEIDKSNSKLLVLAPFKNSMFEYDLKGNFTNKYKLPDIRGAYGSFFSLNTDTIVYSTFDENNLIKLYSKSENKIVKELLPEPRNILNQFSGNDFPYANYLHRGTSNTVFKIDDNGEIVDGYTWDFGKLNNTESQFENAATLPTNDLRKHAPSLINSEIINHIMMKQGGNSKYLYTLLLRKGKHIR